MPTERVFVRVESALKPSTTREIGRALVGSSCVSTLDHFLSPSWTQHALGSHAAKAASETASEATAQSARQNTTTLTVFIFTRVYRTERSTS